MCDTNAPMLQDECRGLSIALASKPDAMMHAREAAAGIKERLGPLPEPAIRMVQDENGVSVYPAFYEADQITRT